MFGFSCGLGKYMIYNFVIMDDGEKNGGSPCTILTSGDMCLNLIPIKTYLIWI